MKRENENDKTAEMNRLVEALKRDGWKVGTCARSKAAEAEYDFIRNPKSDDLLVTNDEAAIAVTILSRKLENETN